MFGLSLISTKKLNHLASECSKLAIANVELSKQNATQSKTIMELTGEVRVLNSKILLNESINDDLQKKLNRKYPRKPYNKKLYLKIRRVWDYPNKQNARALYGKRGHFSQTGTRLLCLLCSCFYP